VAGPEKVLMGVPEEHNAYFQETVKKQHRKTGSVFVPLQVWALTMTG